MDPIDELKKDHASILEQLYSLDRQLGWLESSAPEKSPRILSSLLKTSDTMWNSLARHFQREEESLYPVLENRLGREAEPVAVMRNEHRDLLNGLKEVKDEIAAMRKDLASAKTWGLSSKLQTLRVGLSDHVSREERVLFWLAELHLSTIDKRKVSFELLRIDRSNANVDWTPHR